MSESLRCGWPVDATHCGARAGTVVLVLACAVEDFNTDALAGPRAQQVLALCDEHLPQTGEASRQCEHRMPPSTRASGEVEHRM